MVEVDQAGAVPGSGTPRNAAVLAAAPRPAFSICTLVSDRAEYDAMVASFIAAGFDAEDCEYLFLDNSRGNAFDAFAGYNLFLSEARGSFVILCHQDILLEFDRRRDLEVRLAELALQDPRWGVCGNAGGIALEHRATRISDPNGEDQQAGPFPARVSALDENFMVVRRDANLALSHDLSGFHFYGADLCIVADVLGRTAYVIDFHLRHGSGGRPDAGFYATRRAVARKYRRAFRTRWVVTSITDLLLTGSRAAGELFLTPVARGPRLIARLARRWRG